MERGHPCPQSAAGAQNFSRFALMRARMPALRVTQLSII